MKIQWISLVLCALALHFISCERFTDGYEVSPNLPPDAPTAQVLTGLMVSEGYVFSSELPRITGIWSGYFTGSNRQYLGLNAYLVDANDFDSPWENIYQLVGKQARIVQAKAESEGNFRAKGIAQVLEANLMGTAAALWGNIPYSQAFADDVFPHPAFDAQRDVYRAVQAQLDSGIANLGRPGASLGIRDIYDGGDPVKWITAAHSIKARYYLHTGEYAEAATHARLGIANPAGDMKMPYAGTTQGRDMNPFFDFVALSRAGDMTAQGAFALTLLQGRNNAKTNETGRTRYFYSVAGPNANLNTGANGFFAADTDFPLVTFEENQLILAEALLRTYQPDLFSTALEALNQVRRYHETSGYAAFGTATYQPYEVADFGFGQLLNPGTRPREEVLLQEILAEKYLSLIGQIESFNDIRRAKKLTTVGGNILQVPLKNPNAPGIPQRLLLPQSEINTNPNIDRTSFTGLFEPTPVNQ